MGDETDTLYQCLEDVAAAHTDITEAVYERLERTTPSISQHISHMDANMKGRMLDQVYQLLLGEANSVYLAFETNMHAGYGADLVMYRGVLEAVRDEVAAILGETWTVQRESAWNDAIERVAHDIEQLLTKP